jgi:hypothetical protein
MNWNGFVRQESSQREGRNRFGCTKVSGFMHKEYIETFTISFFFIGIEFRKCDSKATRGNSP